MPRSVEFRVEIGPVPRRDRFDGGAPGGRGREAGISARVRRRRRRTRAEMSTSTGARPCAGGFPHERRTARPARARPAPRGRTRCRTVVPRSTGSYPTPHGRTLKPPYSTTRHRSVRPRAFMYDRPEATAAGPVGRTTARATAPPHDPPTAPDPTRPITPTPRPRPPTPTTTTHPDRKPHSTSVRQPPPTTGPATNHPTAQPRQRTELEPELDRTRAGTEPNSTARTENRRRPAVLRAEGDGPPSHEHARLPHDRDHHQDRRPVSVTYPDWRPRRSSPRPRGRGNDRPSRRA